MGYTVLSTLSRYATPLWLPCKTYKSNLQLKEKHPRQLHHRHRTMLYPSRSHHEMQCFYDDRLDRGHPWSAIKIEFRLTKKSFPILRIFQRKLPHDQFHRACRWRNDSCGRFMGRLAHLRHLLTALTDEWIQFISNTSLCRAFTLSSLGVCGRGVSDRGCSSTIPVIYRMVYIHLPCHPSIANICLWHANSLPPLC
jgi:hypothetical protein